MKIKIAVLLLIIVPFWIQSQHLTISTSGQTGTSGTNWSISGNTLNVAASGSANIHPNVISNHLNSVGNLTVVLPFQSGVARQCSIDGTITYTGSATRTLTFLIANDIFITTPNQSITATGSGALNVVLRAANSGGVSPDNGRISIRQNNTINTNGGHLWIGGGSVDVTWNGLTVGNHFARTWSDSVPGLWIENSTLNTNGGNVYLAGLSHNSSANSGVNYGVHMLNSDISSVSGNIEISGELKGRYQIGNGTRIESTTTTATSITTTTGSITISGKGYDDSPNDNGYRFGAVITGSSSTAKTIISSTSGNIQIEGNAYFAATVNDKEGLGIGGATEIISRSGNITIRGTNTLETSGHYCNSIRFDSRNESNSIRVGFDGTNSYTGNILIEGNSIYQRYLHSSAGSIAVQTTGTLTIQPTGNAFTYMRANDPGGTLTYDNDWNFGTTLSSFTLGKSTNTTSLTFANVLSTAGPITIYGGNLALSGACSTTVSSGHINLIASGDIIQSAAITTQGGSLVAWADRDGTGGGRIHFNANITTNGGHIYAGGGTASETPTSTTLTVPTGYASSTNAFFSGLIVNGNTINSGGGTIRMKGSSGGVDGDNAGVMVYNSSISSGAGALTLDGKRVGDPFRSGGLFIGTEISSAISTGNVTISSTSGNIHLEGTTESITNNHSWACGLAIVSYGGDDITISSTTGNINMFGDATNASAYVGEAVGLVIQSDNVAGLTRINTDGGAISITGSSGNTGNDFGSSYRGANIAGNITIGDANTGNITLRFGSLSGNTNAGAVSLQSAGNYVLEGISGGGFAAGIDINGSYSFGSAATGLRVGSTANNQDVVMRPNTTIAGPITIYANQFSFFNNLISSTASDIGIYANTHVWSNNLRQTIQTAGGNIYL